MVEFGSMTASAAKDPKRAIGHSPEDLTLEERLALTGKIIALEIYSPDTLPLRRIEAIGDSIAECAAQLSARGLDPMNFEFSRLSPPY
jgi:hypothetical protein